MIIGVDINNDAQGLGRALRHDALRQPEGGRRRSRRASRQHDQEGRRPDRRRRLHLRLHGQCHGHAPGAGGLPSRLGPVDHHRRGAGRCRDRHAPVPAGHGPRVEGHGLRRRARPHGRAQDRRLVHGQQDRDRSDDHAHHAAGRHQQGLRPHARGQEHPQRGGLLSGHAAGALKWAVPRCGGSRRAGACWLAGASYVALRNTVAAAVRARSPWPGFRRRSRWCATRRACRTSSPRRRRISTAALGFVHAQDRLWQMELLRRTGQGRLSEIFGERTFTTDVFLRTLDLVRPCRALAGRAAARGAQDARSLRARRQRLPQSPDRLARAAPAAGIPDPAAYARALAAGRQHGGHQDDGPAALDQHQPRDVAPDLCGAGSGPGRYRGPDAARCGRTTRRPLPTVTELYPLHRPGTPRKQAALEVDDLIGIGRLQQLGRVRRAHPLGQAAARQRSASAADGAVDLVPGAPGAGEAGGRDRSTWRVPAWPACR